MTFGQKVRKYREERGLSVTELAKMANLAQPTISQFESGVRKHPYPNTKIALAMALRVKPSDLDDDQEEENNGREADNPEAWT